MSYEAYLTVTFQKSIKLLKKKFRSVKDDLYGEFKIYLLTAYFKGEKTEIKKREIDDLLKKLNHELE